MESNTYQLTWLRPLFLSTTRNYLKDPFINMKINIDNNDVGISCRCRWLSVLLDISVMQRILKYTDNLISSLSSTSENNNQSVEAKNIIFSDENNQKLSRMPLGESLKQNVRLLCEVSYFRVILSVNSVQFSSVRLSGIDMDLTNSSNARYKRLKIPSRFFDNKCYARRLEAFCETMTQMKIVCDEISAYDLITTPKTSLSDIENPTSTLSILEQKYDGQISLDLAVSNKSEYSKVTYVQAGSTLQTHEVLLSKSDDAVSVAVTTSGLKFTLLLRFIDDLVFYILAILDCIDLESISHPKAEINSSLEVSLQILDLSVILPRNSMNIDEALAVTVDEVELHLIDDEEITINIVDVCGHAFCYDTRLQRKMNLPEPPIASYLLLEKTNVGVIVSNNSVQANQSGKIDNDSVSEQLQTTVTLAVKKLYCYFGQPQYNIMMALISEHFVEEMNFGKKDIQTYTTNDIEADDDEFFQRKYSFDVSEEGLFEATKIQLSVNEILVDIISVHMDENHDVERKVVNDDNFIKTFDSSFPSFGTNGATPMSNGLSPKTQSKSSDRLLHVSVKDLYCGVSLFESQGQLTLPYDAATKVSVSFERASVDDVRYNHIHEMHPSILVIKPNDEFASQENAESTRISERTSSAMKVSVIVRVDSTVAVEINISSLFAFLPYLALGNNRDALRNKNFRYASLLGTSYQLVDVFQYQECEKWLAHTKSNKNPKDKNGPEEDTPLTITNIILKDISIHIPISFPLTMTSYDCLRSGYANCTHILYIDIEMLRCLLVSGGMRPATRIIIDLIDWNIGNDDDIVGGIIDGGSLTVKTTIRQEDKVRRQNISTSDSSGRFNAAYVYENVSGKKDQIEQLIDIIIDVNVYQDIHLTSAFSHIVLMREIMHTVQNESKSLKLFEKIHFTGDVVQSPSPPLSSSTNLSYHLTADKMHISGIHWKLVDDRSISPAKPTVLVAGLTETYAKVSLYYQMESLGNDESSSSQQVGPKSGQSEFMMSGKLKQILYVKHLNSTFESTIDTVDPWPYTLQCEIVTSKTKGLVEDIWFESNHRLNVYYAHSLLRCFNDIDIYAKYASAALGMPLETHRTTTRDSSLLSFIDDQENKDEVVTPEFEEFEMDIEEAAGKIEMSSYTIVNHTGLCLWYGRDVKTTMSNKARPASARPNLDMGKTYTVHHNDADILRCTPQIKDIYVKNKSKWELRKSSHSLVLWFEGCWTPIEIVIDRVGKTKYEVLSPTETTSKSEGKKLSMHSSLTTSEEKDKRKQTSEEDAKNNMLLMHVVVDVVLFSRNKVIHIHSSLWLQNLTKFALSYKLYMPRVPAALKRKRAVVSGIHGMHKSNKQARNLLASEQKKRNSVKSAYDYYERHVIDDEMSTSSLYIRLESGQGMFLPLYAMLGGLLYVKIDSQMNEQNQTGRKEETQDLYGWSERDVIYLSGGAEGLKHQQGSLQVNYAPIQRKKEELEDRIQNEDEETQQKLSVCLEICISRKGSGIFVSKSITVADSTDMKCIMYLELATK